MTIWKFALPLGETTIQAPTPLRIISVGQQDGQLVAWALIDPDQPPQQRHLYILGTGHPVPPEAHHFHGTVQMPNGLVWHVMADQP